MLAFFPCVDTCCCGNVIDVNASLLFAPPFSERFYWKQKQTRHYVIARDSRQRKSRFTLRRSKSKLPQKAGWSDLH